MTHADCIEMLSAFLDGELPDRRRAEVEAHLAGCAPCREAGDDLRGLIAVAGELPPAPPERDLWPGIAARLGEASAHGEERSVFGRRHLVLSWPQALAAAAAVAAVALAGSWWLSHPPAPDAEFALGGASDESLAAASASLYATLSGEVRDLEARLDAEGERLDPETVRILRKNLRLIEEAIGESRSALAADPARAGESSRFVSSLSGKLELLRQATDAALTQGSGG